jgi:hypothetical protein
MRRALFGWLAPLLLAGLLWLPAARAQPPGSPGQPAPAAAGEAERSPPALQYAVAFLCSIVVLLIVCMPSRKA